MGRGAVSARVHLSHARTHARARAYLAASVRAHACLSTGVSVWPAVRAAQPRSEGILAIAGGSEASRGNPSEPILRWTDRLGLKSVSAQLCIINI